MANLSKNNSLSNLLDFIQFLENTSALIHRVNSESAIFNKLIQAFSKSKSYSATVFLLNSDRDKLITAYSSIPSKSVRVGEKLSGLKLIGQEFKLPGKGLFLRPLEKMQTVEITMQDILAELMPKKLAGAVQLATGYASRRVILTPLMKSGRSIGVLGVSAVGLSAYLQPSFKNLAYHVSTALERAEENLMLEQSQRALKENERTARVLLDTPSDVIFLMDPRGKLLDLNKTLSKKHNLTRKRLIGKNYFDLIPRQVAKSRRLKLNQVVKKNKPVQFQDESLGEWRDNTLHPILNENGRVEKIAVFSHDITDLKLAEARLTEARNTLQDQTCKLSATNQEFKLLSRTAAAFSKVGSGRDIFNLIGKYLLKLSGKALVAVAEFDKDSNFIILRFIGGNFRPARSVVDILGHNPIGKKYPISVYSNMNSRESGLIRMKEGLQDLSKVFPQEVCSAFAARFSIGKVYTIRFARQNRLYGSAGVLMLDHSDFQMPQIVQMFVYQASVGLQRWKLEKQLEKSHEDLRKLNIHLQSAREEERRHVAREIHDDLGQILTAFKIELTWLKRKLNKGKPPIKEKLVSMQNLVESAITTVKRISSDLRPGPLADLGLRDALEWQVDEFAKRTGIRCNLDLQSRSVPIYLNEESKIAIFRIFQETLTNILRHSQATELKVGLNVVQNNLFLSIHDNGLGITEEQIADNASYGILGIKERVDAMKGEVKFEGKQGKGTRVFIKVPIHKGGSS